jgi:hypothetical protein
MEGWDFVRPFTVWSPLLLIATALIYKNINFSFKEHSKILLWLFSWIFLLSIHFVFSHNFHGFNIIALAANYHFALLFVLFLILASDIKIRTTLVNGFTIGLFIAILLNCIERLTPLPFTMQSNRSAGFFLNANGSAEAIIFLLLAKFLSFPEQLENNSKIAGLSILGLGCSLSRGGAILMIVALLVAVSNKILRPLKVTKVFLISYAIFLLVMVFVSYFVAKPEVQLKIRSQHTMGGLATLLAGDEAGASGIIADRFSADSSAQQRFDLALNAINKIVDERIIWGLGVGALYTQKQRTHNFFLESWIETGIFSLLFLPLYLFMLLKERSHNPAAYVLAAVLFVVCFLSHNVINSKVIAFAMSLAFSQKKS